MILHDTLFAVLSDQHAADAPDMVPRSLLDQLPRQSRQVLVLSGVRRCGKSVLQTQLMRREGAGVYCNFEDTRLFGFGPDDFRGFLSALESISSNKAESVFLDEVQEVTEWERLVRALLDRGRRVCVTGSNASILNREVSSKLTGRHLSFEVTPFSYREFLTFTGRTAGRDSAEAYLDNGGFPIYLHERNTQVLQELLRDVVQRDIVTRHGIRDVRPLMNLTLFLMCNTGQPLSLQKLTRSLQISTVSQTSRFMSFLLDSYLFMAVPKFSSSYRQRIRAPQKYYSIDNGLRKANSPQQTQDRGHRLENAVGLSLHRRGAKVYYAGERDLWECDFITDDQAIQVCSELTPENMRREVDGAVNACQLPGKRSPLILTLDQEDTLGHGDRRINVIPVWKWLD